MIGFKKIFLFGFYILVIGVVLLYVLFPADDVRNHLVNRINQNLSKVQVSIESLRLRFPLTLGLEDVSCFKNSTTLVSLDRMKLSPRLLSLLSGRKAFSYRGQLYQGTVTGSFWVEKLGNATNGSTAGSFSEIRLGQLTVLQEQSQVDVTGILSGNFQLDASTMQAATGNGDIVVSDCNLVLPESLSIIQQLLGAENIAFDQVRADLYLDGSSLEIQNGELVGPQLKGSVFGTILLATPVSRSEMDLEIAVTPLLSSTLSEINELTFRATGTFENPKFSPVPAR